MTLRLAMILALGFLTACQRAAEPVDCVPAPAPAKPRPAVERTVIGKLPPDPNADWCQACVMSPRGYASCQRPRADKPSEPRETLRQRARAKACVDAGFTAESCPEKAIISLFCKGEPPPANAGNPAQALQNLYQQMSGKQLPGRQPATNQAPAAAPAPAKPVHLE